MKKMFDLVEEIKQVKEYAQTVENEFYEYLIENDVHPVSEKENQFVKNFHELYEIGNTKADNCKTEDDINNLTNRINELRKKTNYRGRESLEHYNVISKIEVMREVNSSLLATLTKYLNTKKISIESNHPLRILKRMIVDLNDSLITQNYAMNELELIQEKFNFARDYIKEVIKNDE